MTSTDSDLWLELLQGNDRYRAGSMARRSAPGLTEHRPVAAVLACSDARAVPDDVFDAATGELFTVRSAGHTVDAGVLGSLEYAVAHLHAPLLVVLGHTHCGAVAAAHDVLNGGPRPPGALGELIGRVVPDEAPEDLSADALGRLHVLRVAADLVAHSQPIAAGVAAGQVTIRAAQLQLEDGALRTLA